ncbi:hypothetical protein CNMCM5793_008205 [Aspergillus hiratsukae]|uniref:Major facilitator superfamily (MFS) profile domain-containing protein n=1 Tax=Aspergillus hiratsukae TaxID=1194566 RepID=A0A8H6PYK7_9EURO|nr:hypothetical protein CNMCM5793_008205 [Aspergillus hiratsukae]KAF7163696.1 hypothetical protein CNMCM6106_000512 [Aspergillus hiratsukae]
MSSEKEATETKGDLKEEGGDFKHDEILVNPDLLNEAVDGENREHEMGLWQSVKSHPWACLWAFTMCFTIVMESFDMFLNGNFVAQSAFQQRYGVQLADGSHAIPTRWQSALFQSGQCGAFVGVFLAGPITNRIGYRWTTILGLMLMNATIFISFFADSLEVLTVGQALEGVPWGFFIANAPAYASEIVPLALRGACTATLQMSWSIGGIIVAAATYGYNKRDDEWAWRVPLALQWIFPTPLMILLFLAPESPWWLIRRGRKKEALTSIKRLGTKSPEHAQQTLAMMERTVKIEEAMGGTPTLLDLFKGTDLRRTAITCLMYASQNFAGNLIANQATFFFEQAGISHNRSFQLNLINSCLGFIANACSWPLTGWFGRRTIYLWGTAVNITLLIILGICASIPQNSQTNYAQACLGIVISFVFAGAMGPISYTVISETSSVRLRALSTGVGRAAYYVAEIPMIYLASQMLNPTGWNMAGKCGYVWGGTALVCWIMAYFFLPELKHRSYREADILFNRKVPARKFKTTVIDVKDNEVEIFDLSRVTLHLTYGESIMPAYWPGGIPSHIRPHHTPDLSFDEIKEEVKGWLLFVKAGVREDEDDYYELRQRRALVDQWAAATQEFRDSFDERAPIDLPGTEKRIYPSDPDEGLRYPPEARQRMFTNQPGHTGVICLAPVDAAHPANKARWVKFLILLYRYDHESGHCLVNDHTFSVASLNPATTTTASFDDFLPWLYLESALFSGIYLTRGGTVLYLGQLHNHLLVDEQGLRTVRLAIVDYNIDGTVKDVVLWRPFNMFKPYLNLFVNGLSISDVVQGLGGGKFHNQPMDMDLPILDILQHAKAANQLFGTMNLCALEDWKEDIEVYASGYLALEAAGRGLDYDLRNLVAPEEVMMRRKPALRRLLSAHGLPTDRNALFPV